MLQIYTLFIIMRKENIDKNEKDVKEEHPLRQGNEEDWDISAQSDSNHRIWRQEDHLCRLWVSIQEDRV